jgi:integrase
VDEVRRRVKGQGNKRPDGRWAVRTIVSGRPVTVYGRTQAEARRKAEGVRGEWRPAATGTVADFAAQWLQEKHVSTKPQTWTRYAAIMRLHVLPSLGSLQISRVTEVNLTGLYAEVAAKGLGGTSCHHVAVVLGTLLEDARRRRLIQANPARNVRAPRMQHRPKTILGEAEARRLLDAVRGDAAEALYTLALTTGMRQGELLALHWRDVDLEAGRVNVRGTAVNGYQGREIDTTKTARSLRDIPIPPVTVQAC